MCPPLEFGASAQEHFGALAKSDAADSKEEAAPVAESNLEEEEESSDEETAPAKKKQRKQAKADPAQDGLRKATELGIDFNVAHRAAGAKLDPGHWKKFLVALSRGKVMRCPVCSQLRDRKKETKDEAQVVVAPAEAAAVVAADPADLRPRPKGRPKSGQTAPKLLDWMQVNRKHIYRHITGCRYWCLLCNEEVGFVRESLSATAFVTSHEKKQLHARALAALPTAPEAAAAVVALDTKGCAGISLDTATGNIGRLKDAIREWIANDCLQFESETTGALLNVSVILQDGQATLKHKKCSSAQLPGGLCNLCLSLQCWNASATGPEGSTRLVAVYRRSQVGRHLEAMDAREYASWSKKCHDEVSRCVELYDKLGVEALHDHCFRQWVCHPVRNVGAKLQSFLEKNIRGLQLMACNDNEASAYEALCSSLGQEQEDLTLAAWVAAGGLQQHTAVQALF